VLAHDPVSTGFAPPEPLPAGAALVDETLSNKLKQRNGIEILLREIQIEGILSIQAGDNPHVVEEKLKAFLDPKARASIVMEAHA